MIKEIFSNHWDAFYEVYKDKIRPDVVKDVTRMINCGDISKGHTVYSCSKCGAEKKLGFTCKSRFCSSCGKIYVDERAEKMSNTLIKVKHRHMVFTVPEELRIYFRQDRKRLSLLPQIAYDVLKRYFKQINKKENYTPGVVSVIHTFGRDLKWNPHAHLLVTEGAMGEITEWKNCHYFHYERLRKSWQTGLLKALEKTIKKGKRAFKNIKNKLYATYKDGFYVYGDRQISDSRSAMKYVGRYTGRPAIANSRIIDYDGKTVTYFYDDHKSGERREIKVSVFEFIKRVIIHIANSGFKMIRYYGIYAGKRKHKCKVIKMVDDKIKEIQKKYKSWRKRIQLSFGHDPLKCPNCKTEMTISDVVYPGIGSVLKLIHDRTYEKVKKEIEELKESHDIIKRKLGFEPMYK